MRAAVRMAAVVALMSACAPADDAGGADPTARAATPACAETLAPARGDATAAARAPEIGGFDAAWLCVYELGEEWTLADGPAPIEDLEAVRVLVDALAPADLMSPCTMELGPEYVLTLATGEQLTRIVIDAYGCRWARVEGEDGLLATPDGVIAELDRLART